MMRGTKETHFFKSFIKVTLHVLSQILSFYEIFKLTILFIWVVSTVLVPSHTYLIDYLNSFSIYEKRDYWFRRLILLLAFALAVKAKLFKVATFFVITFTYLRQQYRSKMAMEYLRGQFHVLNVWNQPAEYSRPVWNLVK